MIDFNIPTLTGQEEDFVLQALKQKDLSGAQNYSSKCENWIQKNLGIKRAYLVPSGTHALEMAALMIDIKSGDEVIMPSYTYPSTANAFVLRGARIVFVDIEPNTMNIPIENIKKAFSEKTRAIVPVHYGGVSCYPETE